MGVIGLLIIFAFLIGFFFLRNRCPLCKRGVMKKIGADKFYTCTNCTYCQWREE